VLAQHEGGAYLRRHVHLRLHLHGLEALHMPVVHQITKHKRLRSTHHVIVAFLFKDGRIILLPCFRHGWSEAEPRCQSTKSLIAQADSRLLSLMRFQLRRWRTVLLRRNYLIRRFVLAFLGGNSLPCSRWSFACWGTTNHGAPKFNHAPHGG
jgi:hypothetical protein